MSDYEKIVEALEQVKHWLEKEHDSRYGTWGVAESFTLSQVEKVLPLARELVDYKEGYKKGLEWLWEYVKDSDPYILPQGDEEDCPTIIKKMIGEK